MMLSVGHVAEEDIRRNGVHLLRPPAGLGIGELAEVTVALAPSHAAVVVPNASIRQHGGQTGVWLVGADGLRFAPLRLGQGSLDGRVEVLAGLQPGQRVVLYSEKDLAPDTRFRIVDQLTASQR